MTMVVLVTALLSGGQWSDDLNTWKAERLASLQDENGWLSLAGLFWLSPGEQSFGSAEENALRFPFPADRRMGRLVLKDGEVTLIAEPGVRMLIGKEAVGKQTLLSDEDGAPSIVRSGPLSFYIIKRNQQYGVRLKNTGNSVLKNFKGMPYFDEDESWRIQARYKAFKKAKTVTVPTVVGGTEELRVPGQLVFDYQGIGYRLDAAAEEGDDAFFVILADKTSGEESYGACRFLKVEKPAKDGSTWIDFNRAYNPPCAFTPYATCPLPPAQNRLSFAVRAGEKKYLGDR